MDEELRLRVTEDATDELVGVLNVLETPRRPQRPRHDYSQRLRRKNASIPTSATTMPTITRTPDRVEPGEVDVHPEEARDQREREQHD